MTWDLFSAAEAARSEPPAPSTAARRSRGPAPGASLDLNESVARGVAAHWADAGFAAGAGQGDWSVGEVNALARELIEGAIPPLWIAGEVANFTRARSGHCYFSLRDEGAQIRCVMWRDEARRLPTTPAEGMQVRALGRLTLYEARGEFQCSVSVLEGQGEGLWKLAFERLHRRLEEEGLTDPSRKRPLPRVPACVGVVTSADGAALRDIVTVIRRRAPWTRIVLARCRVQGEGAAAEIAAAIERIGRAGFADVLIVGRGGGSVEDLWAFNEEVVARAIAAAPVPVVSAVGHETDVTIADLVADLRAPTPSAAAESVVPDGAALRERLAQLRRCLADAAEVQTADARDRLVAAAQRLSRSRDAAIGSRRERLRTLGAHLHALSPLATLARGYAVPLDPGGRVLRVSAHFPPERAFLLRVSDGIVPCRVDGAPEVDPQ
jgi:exodeoxyribonuclease VII large subunit